MKIEARGNTRLGEATEVAAQAIIRRRSAGPVDGNGYPLSQRVAI